jgi:citrate lyase subunit beta/citryl-CoA lyase
MPARLRRSLLYAPADQPDLLAKTARTNADAVTFDLEDTVAPANRPAAREHIREAMTDVDFGDTEVCVRVNGLGTDDWLADLDAAVDAGCHAVRLPKVEAPWQVRTVAEVLDARGADDVEVLVTLETPRGFERGTDIAETAASLDSVTGLGYGLADYTTAIGAAGPDADGGRLRSGLARQALSVAAIGDLDPIATVFTDVADTDGLRAVAEDARELGFVGQSVIHPRQVDVVNDVFTPDEERVERLRRLLARYDESDRNSISVEGEFLDEPIVERYRRQVARYERVAGRD